jgi:F-type H+-transporting ATPase subunit delta
MSVETIARRYSTALADVVLEFGNIEAVKSELGGWSEMFASSPELRNVFSNPAIAHADKERLFESLLSRTKPSKTTANFLRILLRNDRLGEIGHISDRFDTVLQERSGYVAAEITSARELPANERAAFQANLDKMTGKRVHINFSVDPDVIGGVVTRIGSTVYDGSVRAKLDNLKAELINA